MMVRPPRVLSLEALALAGIGLVAVGLRLGALDWPPLTPTEASAALGALRLTPAASALDPVVGPPLSSLYGALTALLFDAFGAGDVLARLVPALAGIALLAFPLLVRRTQGSGSTLLAALLLAISPALVLSSRTAGGDALALSSLAIAWGIAQQPDLEPGRRAMWLAALLGVALASGPLALTGILGMTLGHLLHALSRRMSNVGLGRALRSAAFRPGRDVVLFLIVGIGAATAVGLERGAIGGVAAAIAEWIRGWGRPSDLGLGTALLSLVIYEPLVLLAGAFTLGRWRVLSDFEQSLATWSVGALAAALIYPGRGPAELAWVVIPLALLAAQALSRAIDGLALEEHKPYRWALIGIMLLLVTFAYLQLAGYARGIGRGPAFDPTLGLGLAIGAIILALVVMVLFGLGWSWKLAFGSAQVVVVLAALALSVSAHSGLNFGDRAATSRELWRVEAATVESRSLAVTARGVSTGQTGSPDALALRLEAHASPVLAWTLRSFPLDAAAEARANDLPRAILRPKASPGSDLAAEYIGQTFSIAERKAWSGILPSGILAYLVHREAPSTSEQWLLLVRADVASFGELPAQPEREEPES